MSADGAGDGNGNGAGGGGLLVDGRSGGESMLSRERLSDLTGCGHCTAERIAKEVESA